jgi:hypothetical protein
VHAHTVCGRVHSPAERELQPAVKALRVGFGSFGEDDGEAGLAEVARDVRRADYGSDPFAGGDQIRSSALGEVEEKQAELAVVAPCASDLATQTLLEIARVVQTREEVRVREPARLGEEPRVVERRAEHSGELFELLELPIGERALHSPPEDRERADGLVPFGHERDGQPAAEAELVVGRLLRRVQVGEADRPCAASLGGQADELAAGLVSGQAECRNDGIAYLLTEDDHGAVGTRDLAHGLEGPPQSSVEIERAAELAEEGGSPPLLVRIGQRGPHLADEMLRPCRRVLDLGELARCGPAEAPEKDHAEREEERGEAERAGARPGGAFVREYHHGSPPFAEKGELQSHNRADFANYHWAARAQDVYFRDEVGRVSRQRVREPTGRSGLGRFD